jgi:hypothetical protein
MTNAVPFFRVRRINTPELLTVKGFSKFTASLIFSHSSAGFSVSRKKFPVAGKTESPVEDCVGYHHLM